MALAAALGAAAPALAQSAAVQTAGSQAAAAASGRTQFLSRFAFQVGLEHFVADDPRFVWDAHWGGDVDLVDYGRGALTFAATYQTVLGSQFRDFDPVQGNYTLEAAASARAGRSTGGGATEASASMGAGPRSSCFLRPSAGSIPTSSSSPR
ncbi:MAG: hypothetical protein HY824_07955 [Acidobacteria bacterium]|nr:hypothetical protein [Acidobacteriota bacterium]